MRTPAGGCPSLLEALRRYGDRTTVFCQAAQIRLPQNYPRLLTWLEPSIVEVQPRSAAGVFHPKVWVLRFAATHQPVRYRLLCLTRNLTFDRCWDAAVILDGERVERERAFAANHPLGDFLAGLPALALRPLATDRRETVRQMAEDVRRVRFELPEGFEEVAFWHGGIDARVPAPFPERADRCLIMAPFVSDEIVREFAQRGPTHLISRLSTLQALQPATVRACRSALYLAPEIETEEATDQEERAESGEVLDGLHAKLFVVDRGRRASLFTGSFNATTAAFRHNVEFMVELIGGKSQFGVGAFLEPSKGEMKFADLLQPFTPAEAAQAPDSVAEQLEDLLREARLALVAASPGVRVTAAAEGTFDVTLEFRRAVAVGGVTLRCWPLSLPMAAGQPVAERVVFERVSYEGLTPLFAFELRARAGTAEQASTFVMNLTMVGAPPDRRERALAALLENKEKLLRYILFMLAAGEDTGGNAGSLLHLLTGPGAGRDGQSDLLQPCLLEAIAAGSASRPSAAWARRHAPRGSAQSAGGLGLADPRVSENLGAHLGGRPQSGAARGPETPLMNQEARPDTAAVLARLKDFQRATANYVFTRMYGPKPARRFLVADEVGLGKTLVAAGVIAHTINELWAKVPRINVVYICSSLEIARQNVRRLAIPGAAGGAISSRLTLLPVVAHQLSRQRVNFISFTPGTSFEQSGGGGIKEERAVLYWMLDKVWGIEGRAAARYVLQEDAKSSFAWTLAQIDRTTIDPELAASFRRALTLRADLRERFEQLCARFCRHDAAVTTEDRRQRSGWIGDVRRLLAKACLHALQPHLIILDEFQRFKQLLSVKTPAGELADDLFSYAGGGSEARVLLLSATPYKALTLHHETQDDHYGDFLATLGFLEGTPDGFKPLLDQYRDALASLHTRGVEPLRAAKNALETRLRRVMVRTERLALSADRGGMLAEPRTEGMELKAADVTGYLGLQKVSELLGQGEAIEYWKSAPYLLNFMDSYQLKQALQTQAAQGENARELLRTVKQFPETFLSAARLKKYQPIEEGNARLRALAAETVGAGWWQTLWAPPALPYHQLGEPFASVAERGFTKRLLFSAWHVVPKAVACLLSYEAERRMIRSFATNAINTAEARRKRRGLLRFASSENRLTGMALLGLVYPCVTFAAECDPRIFAREHGVQPSGTLLADFQRRIEQLLAGLQLPRTTLGQPDDQWYWAAPLLLDLARDPDGSTAWWSRGALPTLWAGSEAEEEDDRWAEHVREGWKIAQALRAGSLRLGAPPADLAHVLALQAAAAPATALLRALTRSLDTVPENLSLRDAAARAGRAFLSLFNQPEAREMIRSLNAADPFWQGVLEYAQAGDLSAVLEEYVHVLREALGVMSAPAGEAADRMAEEIAGAVSLRSATLRVDDITASPFARTVKLHSEPMRVRFAMRFGDERDEETLTAGAVPAARKERVRAAFNSPFWPFVLVTTSVGQEGLDFHPYCHAVVHWNLPSNPVDLEQREGRVHRYKGHAVRKNLAARHGGVALASAAPDPWRAMFESACAARGDSESDLVPYWLFPGRAKIERHVPSLPFSRETERLHSLRRALAIYRVVFGQSRQEDLITYLLEHVPEEDRDKLVAELRMDLAPR